MICWLWKKETKWVNLPEARCETTLANWAGVGKNKGASRLKEIPSKRTTMSNFSVLLTMNKNRIEESFKKGRILTAKECPFQNEWWAIPLIASSKSRIRAILGGRKEISCKWMRSEKTICIKYLGRSRLWSRGSLRIAIICLKKLWPLKLQIFL